MPVTIPDRAGFAMLSTQVKYIGGEIQFTLVLINQRNEQLTVTFPNSQQFDFIIDDSNGNKIWQWSDGKAFTPGQTSIIVNPQRFHAIDPPDPLKLEDILPPDTKYVVVTGILTSDSMPGTASITIPIEL